MLMFVDEI